MDLTQLLLLITIIAVVFVIFVGVGGLFYWLRRRRNRAAEESTTTSEAMDRQPDPLSVQDEEDKPQDAAEGAGAEPKPKPKPEPKSQPKPVAPSRTPPPMPVSALDYPEEEPETIKILIVDDNPGTRENVGRLLYFEKDMDVIGQAVNGRQGIDMAEELRPHIVLMDINMPDMDGISATKEMSLKTPYSQVVIMSVQAERHYMKQAMAAGARDFQPKPFTADELIGCIRRVYEIGLPLYRQIETAEQVGPQPLDQPGEEVAQAQSRTPVIAVYSGKGGIGTSTLAVNLAVALQQTVGDVALMDADFQFGDVSVHLNIRPDRVISDAVHEDELDVELIQEVMLAHNSGLKLLLAPPQPELADNITAGMVAQTIKSLRGQYKIIVIDTSTHLSDRTLTVLDNADYILLVTTPELPAIKSAKLFLELAPQLEFDLKHIEVIMNRANLPGGIPPDKIEKALKLDYSYHIPFDHRIHTAINTGVAVSQQDASAPSARAIRDLAATIWHKVTEPETAETIQEAA